VQTTSSNCVLTNTVTADLTTFDSQLQNQACNGPAPCGTAPAGSIAFASGAFSNPPANGDFRVARIGLCPSAPGDAVLHWQFSPPDPPSRNSKITDAGSNTVSNPALYHDYTVHIVQSLLVGHVTWQGRPTQPDPRQQLPITLTLRLGNNPEVDYPVQNTDASGYFTQTISALPAGTYAWRVKGPQYLANSGTVALSGSGTANVEMGLMHTGDANNDNVVDITDFTILRASFGKSCGDTGFDPRADFNGDCTVDITDFTLLRANFGTGGAPPIGPQSPPGTPTPPAGKGQAGNAGDAYLELKPPAGAPPNEGNGGTVRVGDQFVLELWAYPGATDSLVGEQSYIQFDPTLLQNIEGVDVLNPADPASTTIRGDYTVFDASLQNEVCNGLKPCPFRITPTGAAGIYAPPGSIAFASAALRNPQAPAGRPFRVAQLALRALAPGQARLHWQVGTADPPNRQTGLVDGSGRQVMDPALLEDYVINIVTAGNSGGGGNKP
jgi:hypothetical protein